MDIAERRKSLPPFSPTKAQPETDNPCDLGCARFGDARRSTGCCRAESQHGQCSCENASKVPLVSCLFLFLRN